jgi:hypothetical protein
MANALASSGKADDAEQLLRDVIDRATEHDRPLLIATAQRDLANLLAREGKAVGARTMARAARETFERLGAKVEVQKLDVLLKDPDLERT